MIVRLPVSVVVPTLNEADRMAACLDSVSWAAEVIVADAGSTDETCAIAMARGARVLQGTGPTIGAQRNAAIAAANYPWVLALDADERATSELAASIAAVVAKPSFDAYRVHMRNRYLGAPMERGGWGRDRHVRFFRSSLRYRTTRVHEGLDFSGPVGDLAGRVDHDSYRNLAHQLQKVTTYARWGAEDLHAKGVRVGLSHLLFRPAWRFVKCYLLQGAVLEGRRGLILSAVHAWSAFAKYSLLWDLERTRMPARAVTRRAASPVAATTPRRPQSEPELALAASGAESR